MVPRMRVLMLAWEFPPRSVGRHRRPRRRAEPGAGPAPATTSCCSRCRTPARRPTARVDGVRVLRARTDLPWLPDDDLVARVASANHHLVQLAARLGGWRPRRRPRPRLAGRVGRRHAGARCTARRSSPRSTRPSAAATAAASRPASRARSTPSSRGWPTTPPRSSPARSSWSARSSTGSSCPAERTHLIPNGIDPTWWSTGESPGRPRRRSCSRGAGSSTRRASRCWPGRCACCARACRASSASSAGAAATSPSCSRRSTSRASATSSHLPGFLPDDRLRDTVHRAGCVVIPSLYEPFGIVALEALAGGAPLVVARTGGLAELDRRHRRRPAVRAGQRRRAGDVHRDGAHRRTRSPTTCAATAPPCSPTATRGTPSPAPRPSVYAGQHAVEPCVD